MLEYKATVRDIKFVMQELLDCESHYQHLGYQDASIDMVDAIIGEAAKLTEKVIAPLNQIGDQQGCSWNDGVVTTPDGFKQLYKEYCESGWAALDGDPEYGGQGLSYWLQLILGELNTYYCPGWSNYPGLTHGARELIEHFANDVEKQKFLKR